MLKRILASSSPEIEVVGTSDGLEPWELMTKVHPHVICTDMDMMFILQAARLLLPLSIVKNLPCDMRRDSHQRKLRVRPVKPGFAGVTKFLGFG